MRVSLLVRIAFSDLLVSQVHLYVSKTSLALVNWIEVHGLYVGCAPARLKIEKLVLEDAPLNIHRSLRELKAQLYVDEVG